MQKKTFSLKFSLNILKIIKFLKKFLYLLYMTIQIQKKMMKQSFEKLFDEKLSLQYQSIKFNIRMIMLMMPMIIIVAGIPINKNGVIVN